METSQLDKWLIDDEKSNEAALLMKLYALQGDYLFNQYEPIKSSSADDGLVFSHRIERWLSCFSDEDDRWTAYKTMKYFLFLGLEETKELYRCAVEHHLFPWLIDEANLDIFSPNFNEVLDEQLKLCWPCPVTDSLRINSLLHSTGIDGRPLRPDWYSLRILKDEERIKNYVEDNEIEYLILFEDFSGSGGQCKDVIEFALSVFPGKIFFSPLVICHPGDEGMRELAKEHEGRLAYSPVVVIGKDCLVRGESNVDEPASFAPLRDLLNKIYSNGVFHDYDGEAFGFKNTGCLYSSYSNCPNNTPPIYHVNNEIWKYPLFPRGPRV